MNDNSCPVDRALTNIESYAKEPSEALQGLLVMKRIIANITTHPNEDKFKIISKKNEVLSKQVFNLRGMHELLKVLGFEEKNGLYKHQGGDEKIKFLEDAIKTVTSHVRKLDSKNSSG
mmetsp:Transcript_1741/g.1605  ORF Transcript_1741/g.1605 Transcript_1741/m.1605 type:complete len:118 (-) Transcript_1741:1142-1495(-)|eukprot:CAMPEP_0114575312 /NCGR_PEP_ID=MMETSP0125-20121206/193_1 /TAXON_ID=485358 ORGANISM="Aristerostoma sp., Strain ATCC 50986" /NCGR_SAMPLE_ID=MMETSP0125 /ASSEMBLY_ACC=CAM_ASM_000245 /LENGTH=117 /DNA_ID=CAMNT_0001762939 /DNA_START=42 /DNA_END=395 /DNA_ORIENTATION=+